MMEYEQRGISPAAAFFILIALLAVGLVIGAVAGLGIWVGMTGQNPMHIEKDMLNPAYVNAVRVLQMVSVLFMFFVPAVITARLIQRGPFKYLGYRQGFNANQFVLAVAIIICCLPVVGALGQLSEAIPLSKSLEAYFRKLENSYQGQVEVLATMRSPGEFIFSLVVMALFPALFEETFFRGGLQQILSSWFKHPVAAIIATSIIFSLAHLSFYGFAARFVLGVVLGLIFHYSKSIWLSMTAHFVNNAFAICVMYYYYLHGKSVKEATGENGPVWIALPAAVLVILLLNVFKKTSARKLINDIPPMDGPSMESNLV
ncbi:MAG: CPBP family intramembrane metalloprotease [Bacteroidota bacterium]|nr:CPBP family intramembrane metalloprotease [Bacteroidota bacterium]